MDTCDHNQYSEDIGINIVIRDPMPADKNLIMSTWLKGNYYGNSYFWYIPQDLYFQEYAKVISNILFDPKVKVIVACDEQNPSWLVGYAVIKNEALYWIYVKRDYREKGIAKLLLNNVEIKVVKSVTKIGKPIAEKKKLIFNPF